AAYVARMRRLLLLGVLFAVVSASSTPALAQAAPTGNEAFAMKRQGYVFYEGRWRLPREVVYLQRGAAQSYPRPKPAVEPTPQPVKMPLAHLPSRPLPASLPASAPVTLAPSLRPLTPHP